MPCRLYLALLLAPLRQVQRLLLLRELPQQEQQRALQPLQAQQLPGPRPYLF